MHPVKRSACRRKCRRRFSTAVCGFVMMLCVGVCPGCLLVMLFSILVVRAADVPSPGCVGTESRGRLGMLGIVAGWAGDVQTLMADAYVESKRNGTGFADEFDGMLGDE